MAKKSKKELKKSVKASAKKRAAAALPKPRSKPKPPKLGGHVNLSIQDVLDFVGGDTETVIAVSRKSLVQTQMASVMRSASEDLDSLEAAHNL